MKLLVIKPRCKYSEETIKAVCLLNSMLGLKQSIDIEYSDSEDFRLKHFGPLKKIPCPTARVGERLINMVNDSVDYYYYLRRLMRDV